MADKNNTISAIRMVCTVAIVSLHITQQYEPLIPAARFFSDWLNLGLVMFFCISAFLYSQKQIVDPIRWLRRRFRVILVPSLLVGFFVLIIAFLTGNCNYSKLVATVLSCLGLQVWSGYSWLFVHLWYLTYILVCYLTVPLIQKIPCKNCSATKFWTIFLTVALGAQVLCYATERLLNIELLSIGVLLRFYLPFFLFRRYDMQDRELRRTMFCLSILSLAAIFATCLCRYTGLVPLPDAISELLFIYTQTLAGVVCFYWLYHGLRKVSVAQYLLSLSDTYSYCVYLTHFLFIGYSTSVIRAFDYRPVGILLALVFTAVSSVAVQKLSQVFLRRR